MAFKKGHSGGPGRPKGATNKIPTYIRDQVIKNFKPAKFAAWCKKNEDLFYIKFIAPMIPKLIELGGRDGENLLPDEIIAALTGGLAQIEPYEKKEGDENEDNPRPASH